MDSIYRIQSLIEKIVSKCDSWILEGEDGFLRFVDPNDKEEISAHYGATHVAASFIIWGKHTGNKALFNKGQTLLDSILNRWDKIKTLSTFHFDFNNLALTMVEGLVDTSTSERIRKTILSTDDSPHDTINWLPMRWAVNRKRFEWSKNGKYQSAIDHCKSTIAKAINADGGIEDRLPHGMSFNLQYDLATVAVLQYLRNQGEQIYLSKELGFLLNAVAPDGDINYQGRGTNQVFAWGLWLYLLSASGQKEALNKALDFFEPKFPDMLEHNNMMLNEWDGKDKYFWWDYHYTSVYTAHCLLWMVMAVVDANKKNITPIYPTTTESGLHIYRSDNAFVSWFDGRSEYLAENGPAVVAIWMKKYGMIYKGTFGPWQGPFGNKYIYEDVVLKNYCGLLSVKRNKDYSKNRILHKLLSKLKTETSLVVKPLFVNIEVVEKPDRLTIKWTLPRAENIMFNVCAYPPAISLNVCNENGEEALQCVASIKNQYGWVWNFQSKTMKCSSLSFIIRK